MSLSDLVSFWPCISFVDIEAGFMKMYYLKKIQPVIKGLWTGFEAPFLQQWSVQAEGAQSVVLGGRQQAVVGILKSAHTVKKELANEDTQHSIRISWVIHFIKTKRLATHLKNTGIKGQPKNRKVFYTRQDIPDYPLLLTTTISILKYNYFSKI